LRSFDPCMPWPEEEFRAAIDARATLLFAPTDISAANLDAEGAGGRVFVTGNTGIDALLALSMPSAPPPQRDRAARLRASPETPARPAPAPAARPARGPPSPPGTRPPRVGSCRRSDSRHPRCR
jgi:hypothetical protein